jgi:hypothetical protein
LAGGMRGEFLIQADCLDIGTVARQMIDAQQQITPAPGAP